MTPPTNPHFPKYTRCCGRVVRILTPDAEPEIWDDGVWVPFEALIDAQAGNNSSG